MMEIANTMLSSELQVFLNYVYEYKKGVRNMVLCTLNRRYLAAAVARLDDQGICHFEQSANENNVNLYFGKPECIAAVRQFIVRPLSCRPRRISSSEHCLATTSACSASGFARARSEPTLWRSAPDERINEVSFQAVPARTAKKKGESRKRLAFLDLLK